VTCGEDHDRSDRPTRGPVAQGTSRDVTRHDLGQQSLDAPTHRAAFPRPSSHRPRTATRSGARCNAGSAARTNDLAPRRAPSTLTLPREATRPPPPGRDRRTANSAALLTRPPPAALDPGASVDPGAGSTAGHGLPPSTRRSSSSELNNRDQQPTRVEPGAHTFPSPNVKHHLGQKRQASGGTRQ
jgi:hypothetical protein